MRFTGCTRGRFKFLGAGGWGWGDACSWDLPPCCRARWQPTQASSTTAIRPASPVMARSVYSPQAQKDARKLAASGLKPKAQQLLDLLAQDPFAPPPRFEKLVGDLAGCYSRRINIQHRLVFQVLPEERVVHVLRMWTHYE